MNHDGQHHSDPPPFAELENEPWLADGNKQQLDSDWGKSGGISENVEAWT